MTHEEVVAGLAQAIDGHPFVSIDGLLGEVERGEAAIWVGERSAVFWRPSDGVIECGPATGDVQEILAVFRPAIEAWGRDHGCHEIFIQAGRQGWARVLRSWGYEEAAVILRKRLDGTLKQ